MIAATDEEARTIASRALTYQATMLTGTYEREKRALAAVYANSTDCGTSGYDMREPRLAYGGDVCGSPATALAQIRTIIQTHKVCIVGLQMQVGDATPGEVRNSLNLFQTKVRPAL